MTTQVKIPDLWRLGEDAARLYQLFLAHLSSGRRYQRIVDACRRIRAHASRGPGAMAAAFTFHIELDALCDLRQYEAAWRCLKRREDVIYGKRIRLIPKAFGKDRWAIMSLYIPLLYFRGRYRRGCALMEAELEYLLRREWSDSYHLQFYVYNSDRVPWHRARVTLAHFYRSLKRDLGDWPQWPRFVNGFPDKLFRLAGIRRDELLGDSALLQVFRDRLQAVADERTGSRGSRGAADLLQSAAKVKKWHDANDKKRKSSDQEIAAGRQEYRDKLLKYFPELHPLL